MEDYNMLKEKSLWVRQTVAKMAIKKGFGHMTTGFSLTDMLVALYHGGILKYDPQDPNWSGQDRFILSEGQAAISIYPILADVGYFPLLELENFAGKNSILGVHSEPHTPGIQVLTGSLGHGLPIATGQAYVGKHSNEDWLTFCITGDGELCEGSNWQAMITASTQLLNKLVLIVNRNHMFTIGRTDSRETQLDVYLDPLEEKLDAFGFETRVIDGHSFQEIFTAFNDIRHRKDSRPLAIIAETVKGQGGFMADERLWHNRVPAGDEITQLEHDLGVKLDVWIDKAASDYKTAEERSRETAEVFSIRDEFFKALFPIFKEDKRNVIVSADDGGPQLFQYADLPGQFINVGIAEEQMIGMAAGVALEGHKAWALAIAPFTSFRCLEFVKLDVCAMNLPVVNIGIGAGLSYSVMGPSHHALGSLASLKIWPNLTIFHPADAVTSTALARYAYEFDKPLYLNFDRKDVLNIYPADKPPVLDDGMAVLRNGSDVYIMASGITVSPALEIAQQLNKSCGLSVGVIDIFRPKPINEKFLLSILGSTKKVVTYEEDYLIGGLGSSIAEIFSDNNINKKLLRIGLPDKFIFDLGGRDVVWELNGLDILTVKSRITKWFYRS